MQGGEEGGNATVAKDLTSIALVPFGEFFFKVGFAFFESAAQRGRCDEEGEQKDCPIQTANSKDDRTGEGCCDGSAAIQTAGFVGEEGDEEGEEKTEEELHEMG